MYILNKLNKESFLNEISEAANLERYILSLNPVEMYSTKSKYQDISVIKFDKNDIGLDKCLMLGD